MNLFNNASLNEEWNIAHSDLNSNERKIFFLFFCVHFVIYFVLVAVTCSQIRSKSVHISHHISQKKKQRYRFFNITVVAGCRLLVAGCCIALAQNIKFLWRFCVFCCCFFILSFSFFFYFASLNHNLSFLTLLLAS